MFINSSSRRAILRELIVEGSFAGTIDNVAEEAAVREQGDTNNERQVRALIVDDEETILEFLGMGLGYEGFTVETASDGPSALAAADRFRPDLVLLDWMLPGLDGVEVCRRLR